MHQGSSTAQVAPQGCGWQWVRMGPCCQGGGTAVPGQPVVPGAKGAKRGKTGSSSLLWLAFLSFLPPNWSPTNPSVTVPTELRGGGGEGDDGAGGVGRTGGIAEGPSPARVGSSTRCKVGDRTVPTARPPAGDSRLQAGLCSPGCSWVNPCNVTPGSISLGGIQGGTCCLAEGVGAQKTFQPLAVTSRSQKHR